MCVCVCLSSNDHVHWLPNKVTSWFVCLHVTSNRGSPLSLTCLYLDMHCFGLTLSSGDHMINIKDGKKQPFREHLVMYGLIWTKLSPGDHMINPGILTWWIQTKIKWLELKENCSGLFVSKYFESSFVYFVLPECHEMIVFMQMQHLNFNLTEHLAAQDVWTAISNPSHI